MTETVIYDAKSFSSEAITLKRVEDIPKLLKSIDNGQNFIIQWHENGQTKAKLVIATSIEAGVKNGKLGIYAEPQG